MELTGKELRQMYLSRFGKILSNLSLLGLMLVLFSLLGYVFIGLYYFLLVVVMLLTFGLILLATGGMSGLFDTADVAMEWFNNVYQQAVVYIAPIVMVISIIAIVLLVKDKQENHTARIGVCGVVILISLIIIIVKIVQMVKGGA